MFASDDGGTDAADADVVLDYNAAEDQIGLTAGLQFADLSITNSGIDAVVSVTSSGEILATFVGAAGTLDSGEFELV